MVEQNNRVKLLVNDEEGYADIKQISDGLAGEFYTEDGWIEKFSEERYEKI